MKTRRREVLLGATAAATAAANFPAPAIAQGIKERKLVTSYPRDLPESGTSPEQLARSITIMSDGRLKVRVYPPDSLVKALEVFDAVSAAQFLCRGAVRDDRRRILLVDPVRRGAGIVGRGRRAIQYQAADGQQYRCADGRLVQQGGQQPRGLQGPALPHAGTGRRGPASHGGDGRDHARRRDRDGPQIRRDRCQRVRWAVARCLARPRQGSQLLLLPGLPRAGLQ